jgi:hypothetical protein
MGTAAAVAILLRKEKEIVVALRDAHATTTESAMTTESLGLHQGVAFQRLRSRAVVRAGARDGTWYLDEPSWEALRRLRNRVKVVLLVVIVALITFGFIKFRA